MLFYKPWRSRVDKRRRVRNQPDVLVDEEEEPRLEPRLEPTQPDIRGLDITGEMLGSEEGQEEGRRDEGNPKHLSPAGDDIDIFRKISK